MGTLIDLRPRLLDAKLATTSPGQVLQLPSATWAEHTADDDVHRSIYCKRCSAVFELVLDTEQATKVARLADSGRSCEWHTEQLELFG